MSGLLPVNRKLEMSRKSPIPFSKSNAKISSCCVMECSPITLQTQHAGYWRSIGIFSLIQHTDTACVTKGVRK